MAVTKIKPVKSSLKKALDYIMNPDKTDGKLLVSSFGCSYETADIEMDFTLSKAMEKGNNLAHHLIQSFEPGETTAGQAHEIGKRLADEILKGNHEYVITTHIDKGHVHNHILFCASSFADYKKYISNRKSYFQIRKASDSLCREYGLSVVEANTNKGRSYFEYADGRLVGGNWKTKLKNALDLMIASSTSFDDFLQRLESQGYEIKLGKYISIRSPGQERFTRTKTLGEEFTEESIRKRIAGDYSPEPVQKKKPRQINPIPAPAVSLIVSLETSIKAQQNAGYARWQKIQNLKEAAKTLNFLTENKLLGYADLEGKEKEVSQRFDEAVENLKMSESRLNDMAVLIKHLENYHQTEKIFEGLRTSKDKASYRRKNEGMLILHEATLRALKSYKIRDSISDLATMRSDYAGLSNERAKLKSEYAELKKRQKEYGIVKRNVDSILSPEAGQRVQEEISL